jgi:hypothetical protein
VEPIRHHQPPARSLPRVRAYRLQRRKIFRFLRKSVPFLATFTTKERTIYITPNKSAARLPNFELVGPAVWSFGRLMVPWIQISLTPPLCLIVFLLKYCTLSPIFIIRRSTERPWFVAEVSSELKTSTYS